MRKKVRKLSSTKSPTKRVLQLSQETVRTLSSEELAKAAAGCPTGSSPTTQQDQISAGCV